MSNKPHLEPSDPKAEAVHEVMAHSYQAMASELYAKYRGERALGQWLIRLGADYLRMSGASIEEQREVLVRELFRQWRLTPEQPTAGTDERACRGETCKTYI